MQWDILIRSPTLFKIKCSVHSIQSQSAQVNTSEQKHIIFEKG